MQVTETAKHFLMKLMKQNRVHTFRFFQEGGCCGGHVGISLEDPFPGDVVLNINDIQIAIEPEIHAQVSDVTIDFTDEDGLLIMGLPEHHHHH